MPKQKITKEMVVDAAFELARSGGMEQVIIKNIAERLNCSVQPIYSYCDNMDGLRRDVTERVNIFVREYAASHIDKSDVFRSIGRAYVQIANEEPYIFKIFILQQRDGISSLDDLYESEASPNIAGIIAEELNISARQAKELHLNMLIYTIGLGAIFSVTAPGISANEIFAKQQSAYEAFLSWTKSEGKGERNGE